MVLPSNKTKIVCTIGPASETPAMLERLISAGMDVARVNFSHGDFVSHRKVIENLRRAAQSTGRRVAIMGDLPGPKMRIGSLGQESIELKSGDTFTLTTEEVSDETDRASVTFKQLPQSVRPGDKLFLNDGFIQLEVASVEGNDVRCRVLVGGELRSRKGLNLPGIDLGISAFTAQDRKWLTFAKEQNLDAISQSFVENAEDIQAVREAANDLGYHPFIIAKIERSGAIRNIEDVLDVADGIMIARGDLGVEVPIERIAAVQKTLIHKANLASKPVITATQMLESMTDNRRPTRAEATDVANAILDGTDAVMLSEESAVGNFPVDATAMLAKIATVTEPLRERYKSKTTTSHPEKHESLRDLIAWSVHEVLNHISPALVIAPTRSGATARRITRFRLPVWIAAVSPSEETCRTLQLSYGVYPVHAPDYPEDWQAFARDWLHTHGIKEGIVVLTEGPSTKHPQANNRMEIIDLRPASDRQNG
jgi:pyruvate kinase